MSDHSIERMEIRGVDKYCIASAILALGERIFKINPTGYDEGVIIDKTKNIAVIFAVETVYKETVVKVITVINRANIFVKTNTKIFNI